VQITEIRATGGGARSPFWMQILADVLGVRVQCVESAEGPALGAAILAGVGTGVYRDFPSAAKQAVRLGAEYRPNPKNKKIYDALHAQFRRLYPALAQVR
jgi:xylulokinase